MAMIIVKLRLQVMPFQGFRSNCCFCLAIWNRSCAEEYAKQSSSLTLILLNLIATSLALPEGSVDELLGSDGKAQVFGRTRVNHYPVCANSQLTWGLQGHTDPSILTLLHQDDVGGLQICLK